jgi:hypothetical protein
MAEQQATNQSKDVVVTGCSNPQSGAPKVPVPASMLPAGAKAAGSGGTSPSASVKSSFDM